LGTFTEGDFVMKAFIHSRIFRLVLLILTITAGTITIIVLKHGRAVDPETIRFGTRHGDISGAATLFVLLTVAVGLPLLGDAIQWIEEATER
jgi:hypothetical protein